MITAQDIGALAMIEKLKRIWVPEGTPSENIFAGFDGDGHRRVLEEIISKHQNRMLSIDPNWKFSTDPYNERLRNDRSSYLRFYANLGNDVQFWYHERHNSWDLYSSEPKPEDEPALPPKAYPMGCISLSDDGNWDGIFTAGKGPGDMNIWPKTTRAREQFTAKWLPFFRRNCWLCGWDIECSREEMREWVQDLTSEEIEGWQLKF